jgi:hypothetical protein
MTDENTSRFEILNGWKEIANHLGKGVRTLQRYERELHLPIHRPAGKSAGAVFALQAELDDWATAAPIQRNLEPKVQSTFNETNRVGADFLRIDSKIALTLSSIALGASELQKKRRTAETARKAYDAIMRLREILDLTEAERDELETNLHRLKGDLESLGQTF